MSYCRFSDEDSDIYLVKCGGPEPDQNVWTCFCSADENIEPIDLWSYKEVFEHLKIHKNKGDKVPPPAVWRLQGEFEYMCQMNPTPENIETAVHLFFSEDIDMDGLKYCFECPTDVWQDQFLSTLESIDFVSFHTKYNFFAFIEEAGYFSDRYRIRRILEFWASDLTALINRKEELRKVPKENEKLLVEIFGEFGKEPTTKEILNEIQLAIHGARNEGPIKPRKTYLGSEQEKNTKVKVVTVCPKCKEELATHRALMCIYCGFQWFKCPECNSEWERGSRTCKSCNKKIDDLI